MKKSFLFALIFLVMMSLAIGFTGWLSLSSAPQVKKVPKPPQKLKEIPDFPVIAVFTITPDTILRPEKNVSVTFKWKVTPGLGGAKVTNVKIRKTSGPARLDPNINERRTEHEATYTISDVSWSGNTAYTLTATNEAGKSSTKTAVLKARYWGEIRQYLTIASFTTEPAEISRTTGPYTYILKIKNDSTWTVSNIFIYIRERELRLSPALSGQKIKPGINVWRLDVKRWSGCPLRLEVVRHPYSQEPLFERPIVCEEIKYYKFKLGR